MNSDGDVRNDLNKQIITLARKAIEEYTKKGSKISPPEKLPEELKKRRGVFVSLKKNGNLRGCIGTVEPTQENVAQEIIRNAIQACSSDPRFPAITKGELNDLKISVDILGEKEKIDSIDQLNPEKYGVLVKKDRQTGLLLPDLEGIDSAEEQVDIACKKAGIVSKEDIGLYRFEVKRFE